MKAICERHGSYEAETVEIFGKVIISNCPICEQLLDQAEAREDEEKKRQAKTNNLIARGVEPELFGATLENYIAENTTEAEALKAAQDLAEGRIKKLILLGQNGTGKTHLACALVKKLGGVRVTMFELSAKIRAGYNNGQSELDILDDLLNKPFIALDEIGRTKGSDAEKNWISYLMDKAHTRGIPLLLISNRQRASNLPQERRGEAFEFFFDNDVISRLRQNSKIVEVRGRDRRAGA